VTVILNYLCGTSVRIISLVVLPFNKSLKRQFLFIKSIIKENTNERTNIPSNLIDAIVEIEDRRFFRHWGIDAYSIVRATIRNITSQRLEGASTIVQQLIRNITDEREIKLKRKIKEIMLATLINNEFPKDEILSAYFATYKFGNCIGVFSFCKLEDYNLERLSLIDAAQIAARFKYPTIYRKNYIKYLKRVRTIERKTQRKSNALTEWMFSV
jgi:membrane peptidoglycan carboxypeptidase